MRKLIKVKITDLKVRRVDGFTMIRSGQNRKYKMYQDDYERYKYDRRLMIKLINSGEIPVFIVWYSGTSDPYFYRRFPYLNGNSRVQWLDEPKWQYPHEKEAGKFGLL